MTEATLLDRLENFFAAGEHTENIRLFMEKENEIICSTAEYLQYEAMKDNAEEGELKYNINTNSKEGLAAFNLYKRYSEMIENMLSQFIAELGANNSVSLEAIAKDIMAEWETPEGTTNHLCTAYIAAALDFDQFCELALDYDALFNHEDDNMEEDEGEEEQEEA
ncbi:hypothetical protein AGDE_03100 [Angomonas deanei]|uniref:The ARF-like 2 binding protein BART, putative n=1 Tax=Angomonas deanei TaxID=59799 RepID=A0A7G2CC14_9TRYP|nr:hypothetical protein AGDE_03100 [Angomonas deanei]CAD2216571.1 The ARF-like 2 binding protein BART, putative [Angomonas deanei]|eukprot:EPY40826.1 hypothetical protein AGDE_03100 [Angomonas deanei]